jgi:hypothetical protein
MAPLSAFHADPVLRRTALQRLSSHIEARHLIGGPLVWDGEKGSVVGCLIHSSDPQVFQEQLGLARWLAHAVDAVMGSLAAPLALQKVTELLNAIAPGRDTGPLGSGLIAGVLAEMVADERSAALPAELQGVLGEVSRLHQRSLAGEAVDAATWKAARRKALAVTDRFDAQPLTRERVIASAVEAAAWDPQLSPMVVADVLHQWLALEGLRSNSEFGWTDADDAHIRELLGRMHQTYIVPDPQEKRDVFELLETHHADDATRLRAYLQFGRDHGAVCAERAASLLVRLIEVRP